MAILIEVKKIISGRLDHEDGSKVYYPIKEALRKNKEVIVDFRGLDTVTSSFLNTSFRLLASDFEYERIKRLVKITHSTATINRLIQEYFTRAYLNDDLR